MGVATWEEAVASAGVGIRGVGGAVQAYHIIAGDPHGQHGVGAPEKTLRSSWPSAANC
jgi:hypothetical protein